MNKIYIRIMGMAALTCSLTACNENDIAGGGDNSGGSVSTATEQYVVMSGSGENNGAYMQLTADHTGGKLDPTNPNGRVFFSGNNPDFVSFGDKMLIGMNYPSQGGSSSDYITKAWTLKDGRLTQFGNGVALDGDVKARGIFRNYLIGMSDQTGNGRYERVKFINLDTFEAAVVDGIIRCDDLTMEPASLMEGETWGVGDIAEYGDYVLLSYTTKHLEPDPVKAKATYSTDLADNLYIGVYAFDPDDSAKEYLKHRNTIIRKSADHPGKEAGQIKGNQRSRTETGIEVVGDDIYLFCQSTATNYGQSVPQVPSAVLRISGGNIQDGRPVAIDDDYYVNLTEITGHYLWRCFYLGDNKFCLQMFTEPGTAGVTEGSHKKFGIFDVKTKTYTDVKGMPEAERINDIALSCAVNKDEHTITFEVELTDGSLPALYTISADGRAVRGTEIDTEAIKGVSFLRQH